jgi:glycosyltransferase involved in cell wall biosynthesis
MISILIPCFNTGHRLEACLNSLLSQSEGRFCVLLSDNASTDGSLQLAKEMGTKLKDFKLFSQPVNYGGAANCTFLLNQCRSDFFMFLDSEDELSPDFIETAYRAAAMADESASMFAPRFFEMGRNLSSRPLLISDRLRTFDGCNAFLSALNSNSFEGIGHLFYSLFRTSKAKSTVLKVLNSESLGSLDISGAWYYLFKFGSVNVFDAELHHYGKAYEVDSTRQQLNNFFIAEQYAHLALATAFSALNEFLTLCRDDLPPGEFEYFKNSLTNFFSAKYQFVHEFQKLRHLLKLPPVLS